MPATDVDDQENAEWLDFIVTLRPAALSTLLSEAAGSGNMWRVERLLERGADPEFENGIALSVASVGEHTDVLELLLKRGMSQEARNAALVMSVTSARPDSVRLLLAYKADAKTDDSMLWYAAMNGYTDTAEMLLAAGADVNSNNKALMGIALSRRNAETALVFLRYGADPSAEFKGKNSFEWAAEMHMEDVFQKMRSFVASDVHIGPAFFRSKTLQELRGVLPGYKDRTGFIAAAAAGSFDVIVEKILSTPGEAMRASDLLYEPPPIGPSALVILGQTGQLKEAFDPRLWAGRKQEMLDVFAKVPELYRAQVDIDKATADIDLLALKSRQRKFTLKP